MSSPARILSMLSLALVLAGCGDDPSSTAPVSTPIGQNGYTLATPNGGDSFRVGGLLRVKWTITDPSTSSVSPYLRCGSEWLNLIPNNSIGNLTADTNLTLPDSLYSSVDRKMIATPTGTTCKLKVSNYQGGAPFDTSDAPFTILAK